jgi:hypothetical protein
MNVSGERPYVARWDQCVTARYDGAYPRESVSSVSSPACGELLVLRWPVTLALQCIYLER